MERTLKQRKFRSLLLVVTCEDENLKGSDYKMYYYLGHMCPCFCGFRALLHFDWDRRITNYVQLILSAFLLPLKRNGKLNERWIDGLS